MANQVYRFTFGFSPVSLRTDFQTSGVTAWQPYQEPSFSPGQVRAGGPGQGNNPNAGSYLVAAPGDNVFINLVGPTGWKMPQGTQLQVIVSQANSPATGQGFSPFAGGNNVSYQLTAPMLPDGVTMQFQLPSIPATLTPGAGNYWRYELTIAFTAADSSGNVYYFADDPEMDVLGS